MNQCQLTINHPALISHLSHYSHFKKLPESTIRFLSVPRITVPTGLSGHTGLTGQAGQNLQVL